VFLTDTSQFGSKTSIRAYTWGVLFNYDGRRGTAGKERVFMGCGWLMRGTTVLAVAALLAVPSAFAATPEQIYSDFANDRKLDGRYTVADLKSALQSPVIQGYGDDRVVTQLRPAIQRQVAAQQQPLQEEVGRGGLPFTGLDLALLTAGGLFLLAFGFSLRRLAKAKQQSK
jgi:hypothetical protein